MTADGAALRQECLRWRVLPHRLLQPCNEQAVSAADPRWSHLIYSVLNDQSSMPPPFRSDWWEAPRSRLVVETSPGETTCSGPGMPSDVTVPGLRPPATVVWSMGSPSSQPLDPPRSAGKWTLSAMVDFRFLCSWICSCGRHAVTATAEGVSSRIKAWSMEYEFIRVRSTP